MRKSTIPVAVALAASAITVQAQDTQPAGNAVMTWKTAKDLTIAAGSTYDVISNYEITTNGGLYYIQFADSKKKNLKAVLKIDGKVIGDTLETKGSGYTVFTAAQGSKLTLTLVNKNGEGGDGIIYKNKSIKLFKQVFDQDRFQALIDFNLTEITSQVADVNNELESCELSGQLIGHNDSTDVLFPLPTYAQSIKDLYKGQLSEIQNQAEKYNNDIMDNTYLQENTTPSLKKNHFLGQISAILTAAQKAQAPYTDAYSDAQLAIKAANDTLAAIKDSIADPTKIFVPSVRGEFPTKNYAHDYKKIIDAYNVLATLQTYAQNDTVKLAASKKAAEDQLANIKNTWTNAKAEDVKQQGLQEARYDSLNTFYSTVKEQAEKQQAAIVLMEKNDLSKDVDPTYSEAYKVEKLTKLAYKVDGYEDCDWIKDIYESEYDFRATDKKDKIWKLEEDVFKTDSTNMETIQKDLKALYEKDYDIDVKNEKSAYNKYTNPGSNFMNSLQQLNDNLENAKATINKDDSHSAPHLTNAEAAIKAVTDSIEKYHDNPQDLVPSVEVGQKGIKLNSNDSIESGNLYSHMAEIDALCAEAKAKLDTLNQSIANYPVYLKLTARIKEVHEQYKSDLLKLTESLQLMGEKDKEETYANPYNNANVAEGQPVSSKSEIYKDLFAEAQRRLNTVADRITKVTAAADSIYNADPDEFLKMGEQDVESQDNFYGLIALLDGVNNLSHGEVKKVCDIQNEQDGYKMELDEKVAAASKAIEETSGLNEDNQKKAQAKLLEIKQRVFDHFVDHELDKASCSGQFSRLEKYENQLLQTQKTKVSIDSLENVMKAKEAYKLDDKSVFQDSIFYTTIDSINANITALYDSIEVAATRVAADPEEFSTADDALLPYTGKKDNVLLAEAARIAAGIKELAADKDKEQEMYDKYMAETADKVVNGALQSVPNSGRVASLKALYSAYAEKVSVMTVDVAKKYEDQMKAIKDRIDHIADTIQASYTKAAEDKTGLDGRNYLNNNAVRAYDTNVGKDEYKNIQEDLQTLFGSAKYDYVEDLKASNTASYLQALIDIQNLRTELETIDMDSLTTKLPGMENCMVKTQYAAISIPMLKNDGTPYKTLTGDFTNATDPDWSAFKKQYEDYLDALEAKVTEAKADADEALRSEAIGQKGDPDYKPAKEVDLEDPKANASVKNLADTRKALFGDDFNDTFKKKGGYWKQIQDTLKLATENLEAYNKLDSAFHSHVIDMSQQGYDAPCFEQAAKWIHEQEFLTESQKEMFYDELLRIFTDEYLPEHVKSQTAYTNKTAASQQSTIEDALTKIHEEVDKLYQLNNTATKVNATPVSSLAPSWNGNLDNYRQNGTLNDDEQKWLGSLAERAYNLNSYNRIVGNINTKNEEFNDSIKKAIAYWGDESQKLAAANIENVLAADSFAINSQYRQYGEAFRQALVTAQQTLAKRLQDLKGLQSAVSESYIAALDDAKKHYNPMDMPTANSNDSLKVIGVSFRLPCTADTDFENAYVKDKSLVDSIADIKQDILDAEANVEANKKTFVEQIRKIYDLNKMIDKGREEIMNEKARYEAQTSTEIPIIDKNGNAVGKAGTDGAGNAIFDEPGASKNDSTMISGMIYKSTELQAAWSKLDTLQSKVASIDSMAVQKFIAQRSVEFDDQIEFADRYAQARDSIIALCNNTYSNYKAEVAAFNKKVWEYETNYAAQVDELYNKYIKQVNKYMGYNHALKDGTALNSLYAQEVKNAQASFYGIADSLRALKNEATDSCANATSVNNYFDKDLHYWVLIGEMKDKLNNAYGRFLAQTEAILDYKKYWNDEIFEPWQNAYTPALEDVITYAYDEENAEKLLTDVNASWTKDVYEAGQHDIEAKILPQQYDALVKENADLLTSLKDAYNDAASLDADSCRKYFRKMIDAYCDAKYAVDVDFTFRNSGSPAKFDNKTEADLVKHGEAYGEAAQAVLDSAILDAIAKHTEGNNAKTNYHTLKTLAEKHDEVIAIYESIEQILRDGKAAADAKQDSINMDSLNVATYNLVKGKYNLLSEQYVLLAATIKGYEAYVQDYVENAMQDFGGTDKDLKSGRLFDLNKMIEDDYANGTDYANKEENGLSSWETSCDINNMKSVFKTHLDRDTTLINAYANALTVIAHKAENAQLYYESNENYRTVLGLYDSAMGLMGAYNRAEANVKDAESQSELAEIYDHITALQKTFGDATSKYEAAWGHEAKSAADASVDKTDDQKAAEALVNSISEKSDSLNGVILDIMNQLKDLDETTKVYLEQIDTLNSKVDATENMIVDLLNQDSWAQYAERVFYDLTGRDAAKENYKYSVNKDLVLRSEYVTLEQNINKIYAQNVVTDEDIQSIKDQVKAYEDKVAARELYAKAQQKWYENTDAQDSAHVAINKRSDAKDQLTLFLNKNCALCAYEFAGRLQVVVDTLDFLGTKVDSLAKDTLLDRNFTVSELEWVDTELANIKSEAQARQAAYTQAINNVETPLHNLWALQQEITTYGKALPSAVYDAIITKMQALDTYKQNKKAILEFAEFKSEKVGNVEYKNLWVIDGTVTPENYKADSIEVEKGIVIANAAYDEMKQWAAKGDIDLNGEWLVNDYSMILKMIAAGKAYDATDGKIYRADVDDNQSIDVADLTNEALLIMDQTTLNKIYANNHKSAAKGVTNTTTDQIMALTDGNKIAVELINSNEYAALQMDITLPEGQTANDVRLAARANGFEAMVSTLEDGKARVIVYSSANNTLVGNDGQLFVVGLNGTGNGTVTISNIILSDNEGNRYFLDDVEAGFATGIQEVAAESTTGNKTYYNISGTIQNTLQKGVNIVRDGYNKVKKVLVK